MSIQAPKTKDIEAHREKANDLRRHRNWLDGFKDKTFEELSQEEKDSLLKELFLRYQLIKENR
jgi:hypothetical protein